MQQPPIRDEDDPRVAGGDTGEDRLVADLGRLATLARTSLRVPVAILTRPAAPPVVAAGCDPAGIAPAAGRDPAAECEPGEAGALAEALAGWVARAGDLLVVPDLRAAAPAEEARRAAGWRFYAGSPVAGPEGPAVLALLGRRPRRLSPAEGDQLRALAALAEGVLARHAEARRAARERDAAAAALRRLGAEMAERQSLFDRACHSAKIGVWSCDLATGALSWTDTVYDLFELPRGSPILREEIARLYAPDSFAAMEAARARAIRERGTFVLDAEIVTARGNRRWMRLTGNVECDGVRPLRLFGTKQDITAEHTLWERTRFLAETDVLTGLANRSVFQARLSALDGPQARERGPGALLLVDLDGFKPVNDTFGHAAGDACLVEVAARLRALCREADLVARIGGDEFAILIGPSGGPAAAERVAARVLRALAAPMAPGGQVFQLGASVGIALADGCGSADLFIRADLALYAAKAAGKNTFRCFTPDLRSSGEKQAAAAAEAAAALGAERIEIRFQPRLRLADGGLVGFEAVPRLAGPSGQDPLAAAASEPAVTARIAAWIMERSLRQAGHWTAARLAGRRLALRACAPQLREPGFAEDLAARIQRHGLAPEMIEVEVTEALFVQPDPGPMRAALAQLRARRVRIVLDASASIAGVLGRLRSDPVDAVKLDRALVGRFLASPLDRAVLDAILRFCAGLAIEVIADGIETEAQHEGLLALGCPVGQGPRFAAPLAPEAAEAWLAPDTRSHRVA
ncbi:diguanylate cyclase/phosphodiesterase [Methylobacterium sp. 4-46]|uniref:putative bifunctional diguanylate cyclase/phosphodiesterase n=1 Tax=unclassified Methylobacterium TaxID=2615210 RepID=UPI000152DEA3|nr:MULTISPECIES: EAL domain-containing protein [Methylobacterium]ACA21032.1 diguanylate cyclase/phosphodiesterase [Methylobacterium sp. 4-46]WFT80182.1 EAL domain-containing protein [Methylobacterium nodulans]